MALSVQPQSAGIIGTLDFPAIYGNFVSDYSLATGAMLVSTNANQSTAVSITTGTSAVYGVQALENGTGSLNVATTATVWVYLILTLDASNRPTAISYTTATVGADNLNGFTTSGFYYYRMASVTSTTKVSDIADYRPQSPWSRQQFVLQQIAGLL